MSYEDCHSWKFCPGTLSICTGDITRSRADAIVNAANSQLAGGGGVDGAIHHAAGAEALHAACQDIIRERGKLPAGQAVLTPGFALSAKYIIHTVGPVWHGGTQNEDALLASAYWESALIAGQIGCQSVDFPAISCGVYHFPVERAAEIALKTLKKSLDQGLVKSACMVIFSRDKMNIWLRAGETLFESPAEPSLG